jgi:hypothetical protein
MKSPRVFMPVERREVPANLFCHYCGNTNQWQMDVRVRHLVTMQPEGIVYEFDKMKVDKLIKATESNLVRMLERSTDRIRPLFHCANCGNAELDTYNNAIETCGYTGCPGCFSCGNFIDEDEMREMCIACIADNSGEVDEEFCYNQCPWFDYGLEDVRQHYKVTLDDLIKEATG